MANKFLLELGVEEIPANLVGSALEQLGESFEELLEKWQISWQEVSRLGSPRRLSILVKDLPDRQSDRDETVLGPPQSVAYDQEGKVTEAAKGFARKNHISINDFEIIETDRGSYVGYQNNVKGRPVFEVLPEILPEVVKSISWPKTMYWKTSRFRFVRPIRWCVALWNEEIIPFEFEGIKAGRVTRGHRFLGSQEIKLDKVSDYLDQLRKNYVLVNHDEIVKKISREMDAETPNGAKRIADPSLFEMVCNLNEFPSVICGSFSDHFLNLPKEVLITVMRHHQKYFSLVNESGAIKPWFLTVINTNGDPSGEIKKGHERVLRARLEDAAFFWGTDGKQDLQKRVKRLDQILFQDKLGSYGAKTKRLKLLCAQLDGDSHLAMAANLCKADLTTDMVREFPELQGVMGGLYAQRENLPEPVWKAVYEHYQPVSLDDKSPSTYLGALLSIADKVDTLVGCFSAGIIATGSSDPFGIRRQAQSLVKVLLDHRLAYSMEDLVSLAQDSFGKSSILLDEEQKSSLLSFLDRRLRHVLSNRKGIPYDVLNAVFKGNKESVYKIYEKANALCAIKEEEDFNALAVAYKRIKNILAKQAEEIVEVSKDILIEPEEKALFEAYSILQPKVKALLEKEKYPEVLKEIASLRGVVDQFFDKVLVISEEEKLRRNRVGLLHNISEMFLEIADISEIVQEGSAKDI